jgi:hypothetical protein
VYIRKIRLLNIGGGGGGGGVQISIRYKNKIMYNKLDKCE